MNKVLILRGVQGSGKSHFADNLRHLGGVDAAGSYGRDVITVSADTYFIRDGQYRFNPDQLSDAHADCMWKFMHVLRYSIKDTVVVVDNTNAAIWEISPYVLVAQAFKAEAAIYTIGYDPKLAASRNIHGVGEEAVFKKHRQIISEQLPPWWRQYLDEYVVLDWLRR